MEHLLAALPGWIGDYLKRLPDRDPKTLPVHHRLARLLMGIVLSPRSGVSVQC